MQRYIWIVSDPFGEITTHSNLTECVESIRASLKKLVAQNTIVIYPQDGEPVTLSQLTERALPHKLNSFYSAFTINTEVLND